MRPIRRPNAATAPAIALMTLAAAGCMAPLEESDAIGLQRAAQGDDTLERHIRRIDRVAVVRAEGTGATCDEARRAAEALDAIYSVNAMNDCRDLGGRLRWQENHMLSPSAGVCAHDPAAAMFAYVVERTAFCQGVASLPWTVAACLPAGAPGISTSRRIVNDPVLPPPLAPPAVLSAAAHTTMQAWEAFREGECARAGGAMTWATVTDVAGVNAAGNPTHDYQRDGTCTCTRSAIPGGLRDETAWVEVAVDVEASESEW